MHPTRIRDKKMKKLIMLLAITLLGSISLLAQTNYEKLLVGTKWDNTEGLIYNSKGEVIDKVNRLKLFGTISFYENGQASMEYVTKSNSETIKKVQDINYEFNKDYIALISLSWDKSNSKKIEKPMIFRIVEINDKTMTLQAADYGHNQLILIDLIFKKLY